MVSAFCFSFPTIFLSVGKCCLVEILEASLERGCLSVCLSARAALSILHGWEVSRGVRGLWIEGGQR